MLHIQVFDNLLAAACAKPSLCCQSWMSFFKITHVNSHGFISHMAELEHRLRESQPDILAIAESVLDKSAVHVHLEGYTLISRLDRRDGRRQGGIAFFRQEIN